MGGRSVKAEPPAAAVAPTGDPLAVLARAGEAVARSRNALEALREVAVAARAATAAELVLVRVDDGAGGLVARVVDGRSAVFGAELEGSRLAAGDVGAGEVEYRTQRNGEVPPVIRRAAARASADAALVLAVGDPERPRATLELYRRRTAFGRRDRGYARVAAAYLLLALERHGAADLDAAVDGGGTTLDAAGEALSAASDEAELAEYVVRIAAVATGAARALLWRIEADVPPAFLAAYRFDDGPPDLAAAAARVSAAVEQRGAREDGGAPSARDELVVALGEPAAGALQLVWEAEPPRELDGLSRFAARAGVALRRARRAQLVTLALHRSQTIVAVVSQAIAHLSLSHTLATAVDRISELTASAHVAIYLRERDRLVDAASRGLHGSHTDLAERLLELALGPFRGRGFLFIPDLRRDPRLAGLDDVLGETGVRRALVVPLVVHDEVIGALAVYKQRPRPYRPGEEGLLIALSSQLAVAVQNARLHERTNELRQVLERTLDSERRAAHQLRGLFEISHAFTRSLSLEATLDAVAKAMVEVFGVDAAVIRMPDERGLALEARAVHVAEPSLRHAVGTMLTRPQPLSSPLVRGAVETRRPVVLSRDAPGADQDPLLEPFLRTGATAAILPLATPGEAIGTLTLLSLDPSRRLDAELVETAMTVGAQAALAIENARLYQHQKHFAETMQRSLLPSELPAVPGLEIGHVYESSARVDVGGDVYDFLLLEDGRLTVVLGDVTGKGIQAAADMAMAKFAFRALARSYPDPSLFLARANEVVLEEIAVGKFITMFYALVDPRTGELRCANGGHPPVRLVRADGTIEPLAPSGLALGIDPDQEYAEERVVLEPGTAAVLYTDGVIEARRDGELYGEERLDELLAENAGLPAQALAEAVLADCRAFSGGDLGDDCAIVCLRVPPLQAP